MINGGEVSYFNKLEYLITYFVVVFYADNGLKVISNKTSKTINRLKEVHVSTGQMISYVVVNWTLWNEIENDIYCQLESVLIMIFTLRRWKYWKSILHVYFFSIQMYYKTRYLVYSIWFGDGEKEEREKQLH